MKLLTGILLFFLFAITAKGQSDSSIQDNDTLAGKAYLLQKVERDGVSLPEIEIKEVTVYARPKFPKKRDFRRYERLIYNLKRVYPYALVVRNKLSSVDKDLQEFQTEKERKEYIKKVEKDVFAQYEGDMRQMTITQGRLLIKLIDRETQNTSYTLIKDYRGKLTAVFWQGIARIFGTNLKDKYDPFGEDALIESILLEIEAGGL